MKQKLFLPILFLVAIALAFVFGSRFADQETSSQDSFSQEETGSAEVESPDSGQHPETSVPANTEEVLVKKVVDGDTIELANGSRLRYIGIDTPETVDPKQTVQCYGKEASAKNKELVEGKRVRLETDVSNEDRYGRLLRYVYVGNIFVNDYLVAEGFARASSYPPDIKHQEQFRKSEAAARENNLGLWGSCGLIQGSQTSSQNYSVSLSQGGDCQIKGNISSSGEKIYHLPTGSYYDKTSIDTSKGERWFCTESEAKAAGWRASKV